MIRQLGAHRGKRIVFGYDRYLLDERREYVDLLSRFGPVEEAVDERALHYLTSARAVCERVQGAADAVGVLCCGTGMGMSIAANKFRGIYAARCVSAEDAEMARIINNANVLCLAASAGLAVNAQIIDAFMRTPFEGRKIEQLEHLCDFELEARPAPLSDVRVPAVDDVLPKTA